MIQDYLDILEPTQRREAEQNFQKYRSQLTIGPYVGQIDWRIAEEAGWMNLELGMQSSKSLGEGSPVAWLMDNFGLAGQLPQIHKWFSIDDAVVWRGVDFPRPCVEFSWSGADGSMMLCVWIVDSYRNLMRLGDDPELSEKRLRLTIDKLAPFSQSGALPLMDGYDLDPVPEDPQMILPQVTTWSAQQWLDAVKEGVGAKPIPNAKGELLSGRIACTFPGSLSTRAQLKWYHGRLEHMLAHEVQPVNALVQAFQQPFQEEWQTLLENLIHDSIGGVGVDDVHEEMELRYRDLEQRLVEKRSKAFFSLASRLPDQWCALNLNPCSAIWQEAINGRLYRIDVPEGLWSSLRPSVVAIDKGSEQQDDFLWAADGYQLRIHNGIVEARTLEGLTRWAPEIIRDEGDTYSAGFGESIPWKASPPLVVQRSQDGKWAQVRLNYFSEAADLSWILTLDQGPLIRSQCVVSGKGVGYACAIRMDGSGRIVAGMPYEEVIRNPKVGYELPHPTFHPFLAAAREVDGCDLFPFKGYVGIQKKKILRAFLTGQAFSYRGSGQGISLILTRSVEWLSKLKVPGRIGDAGPIMYTPQAAMRRSISFDLALFLGLSEDFLRAKSSYLNPPLVFMPADFHSTEGLPRCLAPLWSDGGQGIVFSTLVNAQGFENQGVCLGRWYNPFPKTIEMEIFHPWQPCSSFLQTPDPEKWEKPGSADFQSKQIRSIWMDLSQIYRPDSHRRSPVPWIQRTLAPTPEQSTAKGEILEEMEKSAVSLRDEAEQLLSQQTDASAYGSEKREFERLKRLRSAMELELSVSQNRKAPIETQWKIFQALNDLRIRRRGLEFALHTLDTL
jgi:alpha-mannosidase